MGTRTSTAKSSRTPGSGRKKPAAKRTRRSQGKAVMSRSTERVGTSVATLRRRRGEMLYEIGALGAAAFGVLLLLSLLSHHPADSTVGRWGLVDKSIKNWAGPFGASVSDAVVSGLGVVAFATPLLLGLLAAAVWTRRSRRIRWSDGIGFAGVVASGTLLVQLVFPEVAFRGEALVGGGGLGAALRAALVSVVSVAGAWVVGIAAFLASLRIGFGVPVLHLLMRGNGALAVGLRATVGRLDGMRLALLDRWHDWAEEARLRREERRWAREERRAELEEARILAQEEREYAEAQRRMEAELAAVEAASERQAQAPSELVVDVGSTLIPEEPAPRPGSRAGSSEGPRRAAGGAQSSAPPGGPSPALEPAPSAVEPSTVAPPLDSSTLVRAPTQLPPDPADRERARSRLARLTGAMPAPSNTRAPNLAPAEEAGRVDTMLGAAARGSVHAEIRVGTGVSGGGNSPGRQRTGAREAAEASQRLAAGGSASLSTRARDLGPGPGSASDWRAVDGSLAAAEAVDGAAPPASQEGSGSSLAARAEDALSPRIQRAAPRERDLSQVDRVVSARRWLAQRKPFELPELSLLAAPPDDQAEVDEAELQVQARRLEETLEHYAVRGRVVNILPGPVVTMFEFEPEPGIKVSKIANLGDDLAMALRAIKVRIVAPIPGKGAVGIEIPSKERETVYFREILASKAFRKKKAQLPLALGKGVDGGSVVSDMAKFPHILVAGTTGSGKSVCVNSILVSLLYTKSPEEVRLILVDPKMLEFSIYDGIPHLLVPVVTSPKKAAVALKWAVEEMQRRYAVLASMGTRSIKGYNERTEQLQLEWEAYEASKRAGKPIDRPNCGREAGEDTVVFASRGGNPVAAPDKMPYIVIIIDELADLMMVARKEVEESIVRLAQMARACGIHMLLATQRPSVDVITGLIKANFPSRLSFRVSSKVDSRTVLDANGAESLLGMGDGLFLPPGTSDLIRVHGAFVSDDEVQRVVDHLKQQGEPEYVNAVLVDPDADPEGEAEPEEFDSMYDEAVAVVAEAGKASTSLLQRRLKLGYNRAARIIDCMERQGVIGPADGARPREVLVQSYD